MSFAGKVKKIGLVLIILIGLGITVQVILFIPLAKTLTVKTTIPETELSSSEKAEVERLFKENAFSLNNLQPYSVEKDNIGQTHVRAYQIYQGVLVNEEVILHFNSTSGLFNSISGRLVSNIPISAGKIVSNADLVAKSMETIGGDSSYYLRISKPVAISLKPKMPAVVAAFKARLDANFWGVSLPLEALLSVWNKSSGTDNPQDWTLAWTITPKGNNYPIMVIDANSGQTLYSFNGIIY